jgi:hypothetical protein
METGGWRQNVVSGHYSYVAKIPLRKQLGHLAVHPTMAHFLWLDAYI